MKKVLQPVMALAAVILLAASCKKSIEDLPEDQQLDLVVLAMTNGEWKMTWFKEDNNPVAEFNGYEFKYYTNYTVDAMKNGATTQGTWGGNAASNTTSAQFPATAGDPLIKLNGTWNITRNSWTYVEARQESGGVVKTMRLDKK